jgi:ABC-2 type transport system ATP-binding protein
VLNLVNVRKTFGNIVAVDGLSLSVRKGEVFGLLGPNGAGKSTSVSLSVGLLTPDSGSVTIEGHGNPADPEVRRRIGVAPQALSLYDRLTAEENLRFFGEVYGLSGATLDKRVSWCLDFVTLADRRGDFVEGYSGGMKRRLNLAAALIHDPELLLLDEPTVGVDPQSRNAILESVAALGRAGMAILYTTHYLEEAERLCDRVGIIDNGEIRAEGTTRDLVASIGEQDRVRLTVNGDVRAAERAVRTLDGVAGVGGRNGELEILVPDARSMLTRILVAVEAAGADVRRVDVVEPDLEAVFLHLTGRALRDAAD